jgi:hypothetical protein
MAVFGKILKIFLLPNQIRQKEQYPLDSLTILKIILKAQG